jgi:hypothetical protein
MRLRILAALGLLTLTACGSTTPAAVTTTAAPAIQATSVATSPTPTVKEGRQLTATQLAAALVGIDAMPAGYTAEPPKTKDVTSTFCNYKLPTTATGYASRTFDTGSGLNQGFIQVTIRQYASVADAAKQSDALEAALQTCHSMKSSGQTIGIAEMSAPKLGDRAIGVMLTSSSSIGKLNTPQMFFQVGPSLIAVGGVSTLGAMSTSDLEVVATAQIANYRAAASLN